MARPRGKSRLAFRERAQAESSIGFWLAVRNATVSGILSLDRKTGINVMRISRGSENQKDQYDYIVVGAGTAGSVMASRLSERSDVCGLLLEAGPADGPEMMRVPGAWAALVGGEGDWGDTTRAQQRVGGAVVPYPRGDGASGC